MSPSRNSFNETWVPRIGAEGAKYLHRSGALALLFGLSMIPLALIASVFAHSHRTIEGLVFLVPLPIIVIAWVQNRKHQAEVMSSYLGIKIDWKNLSSIITPEKFDEWRQSELNRSDHH
jgi:hypothetical protein